MSVEDQLFARSLRSGIFSVFDRMLPHASHFDRLFLLARFVRAHKRLPKDPDRSDATFNDLIFSRLAGASWNGLERFCIDKHYAKIFIRALCPELRVAATFDVINLTSEKAPDLIASALLARLGEGIVAKPTHGSGTIIYLRKRPSREEIHRFSMTATHSYYRQSRESLYAGMERKVLLEEDLSEQDKAPIDYKFFCSRGEVFFCQVDVDRFRCHKRALVTLEFEPIHVRYMHDAPTQILDRPDCFNDMVAVARKLSLPFSFVRVDLYCIRNAVFFGELTFAPEGGAGSLSSEAFGTWVMAGIRKANASWKARDAFSSAFLDGLLRIAKKEKWNECHCSIESNSP